MILYKEIYDMAVNLFDDPFITEKYKNNSLEFCKIMYSYLKNAIFQFDTPTQIAIRLSNRVDPIGRLEEFDSDGVTKTFSLSTTPIENSIHQFMIDGVVERGEYNEEDNTVTFLRPISEDELATFEWYFPGEFVDNFDGIVDSRMYSVMIDGVKGILAYLLLKVWATDKSNFLLDIARLLNDTDFKLYAESSNINSKIKWLNNISNIVSQQQNSLAWKLKFSRSSINKRW